MTIASTSNNHLPRLRAIDPQPAQQDGRELLLLRDPMQISDKYVAVPVELAPLLALCDGTRTTRGLAAALALRFGLRVSLQVIDRFLKACDEALLLDNERSIAAQADLLAHYRAAAYRPPALAGASYPADPEELDRLFAGYATGRRSSAAKRPGAGTPWTGVISPHIDYQRGGPVYAAVWDEAAAHVRTADLAVVFGTDHFGGLGDLTLTRQSYATPFGVLPVPVDLVDALTDAIGPERAYANELHHRSEHSIELAVTWLHYVRRDLPPLPMLPILCGSFHHFVSGQGHPDQDRALGNLVHVLTELAGGRRVVVVAGADLAHVGPAFGQPPQGPAECAGVQSADRQIIQRMCQRDARGFFDAVRQVGDRYNVCGLAPIYLTLRLLAAAGAAAPSGGRSVAYDNCPADEAGTSFVSVCGVVLD